MATTPGAYLCSMTTILTPARVLLERLRDTLAEALFPARLPATEEQAADALSEVTRWAWLPALSGIAVAGDHARKAHDATAGGGAE